MDYKDKAKGMLNDWKKGNYAFGIGVLDKVGDFAQKVGKSTIKELERLASKK